MPRRGFTLLELLFVIGIMAVAATLVPWRWSPSTTGDTVADGVTTARRIAIAGGTPVTLMLDGTGRWIVRRDASGDTVRVGQLARTAGEGSPPMVIRIDAIGRCRPVGAGDGGFDVARCRPIAVSEGGRP